MASSGYNGLEVILMGTVERAVSILERLSAEKLELAVYLLELLALREELEATGEVAADPRLAGMIGRAKLARREGRSDEFVGWESRHDV